MRLLCLFTLTAAAALAQPQIQFAVNAASFLPPTAANGKLARGSLVALTGTGVGPVELVRAPGYPLPTSLGGVSVEVAAGGSTWQAPIESAYASHTNIVLPSAVPAGPATIKVTYEGAASAAFDVTVVERGVGVFTLSRIGKGTAVLTKPENSRPSEAVNSILTAARAGDVLEVWVTGLGPGSNDAEAPAENDLSLPVEVLVGGRPAEVQYSGRAACCPGYAKIRFRVPAGVAGCCVPLAVRLDNITSNEAAISISDGGATCVDPALTPEVLALYQREGGWKSALMTIARSVRLGAAPQPPAGTVSAGASFSEVKVRGLHRFACIGETASVPTAVAPGATKTIGACTVNRSTVDLRQGGTPGAAPSEPRPSQPSSDITYEFRSLDAGPAITVAGSAGSVDLQKFQAPGLTNFVYQRSERFTPPEPAAGTPGALLLAAGRKTFRGPSGPDVPAFSADVDVSGSLVWTNANEVEAISRNQSLRVTWTGGAPPSPVVITGSNTAIAPDFSSVDSTSFTCTADANAGAFTVPQEVLSELPPSSDLIPAGGSLAVGTTIVNPISLPGFDQAVAGYSDATSKAVRVF